MYQLYVKKEKHRYILEELVREFLRPDEYEVVVQEEVREDSSEDVKSSGEQRKKGPRQDAEKEERDAEKRRVFDELTALTGYRPEWGTLTGVRPAKLAGEMMDAGYSEEETAAAFRERYYVNEEKTGVLTINGEVVEEKFLTTSKKIGTCETNWTICSEEITVPEGEYFVMGDNRDDSKDSRMIGTIPFKDVKGTTELILFPFNRFGKVKKSN